MPTKESNQSNQTKSTKHEILTPGNPLDAADPESIEELFDRDPLNLSESDIIKIGHALVIQLRSDRAVWDSEKKTSRETGKRISGVKTKKLQKAEALKKIRSSGALSLSDLMKKKP